MKKLIVGVAVVGAVVALRPVVKRRMLEKTREHCGGMAEHCDPMGAEREERSERVATA